MRLGVIFNTVKELTGFYLRKRGILRKLAEEFCEAGAEQIEITADVFDVDTYEDAYLRREIELLAPLKAQGVGFSLHAPCMAGIMTGSTHEEIRAGSVATMIRQYQLVEQLGISTVTMHPNALVEIEQNLKPPEGRPRKYLFGRAIAQESQSMEELSRAIPLRNLCMENFHYGDLEDYRPLIEKYDLPVCFDIGHEYVRNPGLPALERFLKTWISRIRNVHIYNVRPSLASGTLPYGIVQLADHQPLTDPRGLIQAEIVCLMLRHYGYDGTVVVEEYHNPHIVESVKFLRTILDRVNRREKA